MEIIKKIFAFLSAMPAFTNLFKKASETGRVDPLEALNALSNISPGTKKVTEVAMNTAQQGGNVADVARALSNVGSIEVMGQKIDPKMLTQDLKKAGGICSIMANILEKMQSQSPEEIVEFGNAASNINNWKDFMKQKN